MEHKLFVPLVVLGVMVVGAVALLSLSGAFDSRGTASTETPSPAATPVPTPVTDQPTPNTASGGIVVVDPDYLDELSKARISTRGWETDFSRHSVPYGEIFSGGVPRDGIPPLDDPKFTTPYLP